jgi:hypothetical protein
VHPNNKLTINAIEAAPLEDFSPEVCTSDGMRGLILKFLISVLIPGCSCEPSRGPKGA